jgi:hypothetical protein
MSTTVTDPVTQAIVGGYFLLVGLVMIVFRKQVLTFYYETALRFPWNWTKILGSQTLLGIITVFGILSAISGTIVLLLALL